MTKLDVRSLLHEGATYPLCCILRYVFDTIKQFDVKSRTIGNQTRPLELEFGNKESPNGRVNTICTNEQVCVYGCGIRKLDIYTFVLDFDVDDTLF